MADYVVRLTGKDELSGTLNKVKQELNQTGDAGSKLDQIRDRFNKITTSSAPLKKQLREIQGMMAQMNLEGLDRSDVFTAMAAKAGEYKDAIGDAAQATRLLSSDTSNLDALMGGLSAISSAASIATGIMGLFGTENENVQQAILRVQSALSILSGVQELSNALNKDSILVLKGQQIWGAIKAAVTRVDTAAIRENTNATGLNTLANVASRLAQQAWNVVKAIGKALLGDFTGLLLVGAGALTAYALATSDSTDAQGKQNQSLKDLSNTYNNTYAQSLSQTEASYIKLKTQYANLKTEHERIEWINNNQDAFRELGLSVLDIVDADEVFINNTQDVVTALVKRAKAAADAAVAQQRYQNALKGANNKKAGNEVTFSNPNKATWWVNSGYATVNHLPWGNKFYLTEKGAQHQNDILMHNAKKAFNREMQEAIKEDDQAKKDLRNSTRSGRSNRHNNRGGSNNRGHNRGGSYNRGGSNNGNSNNTPPPPKVNEIDAATMKYVQTLNVISNKEQDSFITQQEAAQKRLEAINSLIETYYEQNSLTEEQKTTLHNLLLSYNNQKKAIDDATKAQEEEKDATERVAKIKQNTEAFNDSVSNITSEKTSIGDNYKDILNSNNGGEKTEQLQNLIQQYDQLNEKIIEAKKQTGDGIIDQKAIEEAEDKLNTLGSQIDTLAKDAGKEQIFGNVEDTFSNIESITEGIKGIGDSFKSSKNALDYFVASVNAIVTAMQTYETIMTVVNTISSIFNATKESGASIVAATATRTKAAADTASVSTATAATEAIKIQEAAYLSMAAAAIFAAHASIPFAGPGIAAGLIAQMLSQMVAVTAAATAIASFSTGGIIQGGQIAGDQMLARVNAGEMILNGSQQKNLFNLLDSGGALAGNGNSKVEFKISGSSLKGVLRNYDSKMNKIR